MKFVYLVRHAIAYSNAGDRKIWLVIYGEQWEAEESARLEFVERYGAEPDDVEAWPIIESMVA